MKQERQAMHDVLDRALDGISQGETYNSPRVDDIETRRFANMENLSVKVTQRRMQMEYPQQKGPPVKRWERRVQASVSIRVTVQSELNLDPFVQPK